MKVLIVHSNDHLRCRLGLAFLDHGFEVEAVASGMSGLLALLIDTVGAVVTERTMTTPAGKSLIDECLTLKPDLPLFIITSDGEIAVTSQEAGKANVQYFSLPFDVEVLVTEVKYTVAP